MIFLDTVTLASVLAVAHTVLMVAVIPFVLIKKRDPTVAVAWSLVVILTPVLGSLLFWVFGFNYVQRRVRRKKTHRTAFDHQHPPRRREATRGAAKPGGWKRERPQSSDPDPHHLVQIAQAVDAFPVSLGNRVTLYHDTKEAYEAILQSVAEARHHVHLEFYIFRADDTGRRLIELLIDKAQAGVEVRLLYDALGSLFFSWRLQGRVREAGGLIDTFLPVNPLRSWIQVNLRNHRKIVVIDGRVGFTGGMNIGDEYLGKSSRFGHWRDTMLQVEGPAVAGLQRVFIEDWHFASGEDVNEEAYFPEVAPAGEDAVQVVEAGPDQELNSIREIFFAAIVAAKRRLWIASPYFVPDGGLLDALRLARMRGVDVRYLGLLRPDHLTSFYAGRYYCADLLAFGARVYLYARGMMHAKYLVVDDDWAFVGSANFDNRSLHLNFEAGCLLYDPGLVAELALQYERDLADAIPLDPWAFGQRTIWTKLLENAARLFSPVL
ncbi:MAG: cardiolipin synthase [Gemmataceae bacterium]